MEAQLKKWSSFDSLKHERMRLFTFKRWPLPWLSPTQLAKAGFFYLKKRDFVQCAFCRGVVGDWEKKDNPFREHAKYFSFCPLVRNIPVGNIIDVSRPKSRDYYHTEKRLGTFKDWPSDVKQTPRQLAEAGFFYAGLSDHVRCFYCGGGIRNWDPEDDPLTVHHMYYPHCAFVNKKLFK